MGPQVTNEEYQPQKKTSLLFKNQNLTLFSLCLCSYEKKLCKIQNIETEKKELLDVMQAWHGLSKYNSATAVSISFYAQSQKKKSQNQKNTIKIEIINVF